MHKAQLNGSIKYFVPIRNWIHQGFFYLDRTEMFYRIVWELILFSICFYLLSEFLNVGEIGSIVLSALVSHTLNWIFNDNFWACMIFTFPNLLNPGQDNTIKYLKNLQTRLDKANYIGGGMIYGSLSRGEWRKKSDLDIRILRKSGVLNGLYGYVFVFKERIIALFNKQPLDIYLADSIKFLKKMRIDEHPVFLKNSDKNLSEFYRTTKTINFSLISTINNIRKEDL
jgi:predicted nucleotidyltransferase